MPTLLERSGCQAGVGSALVAGAQIAWRWPPSGELPVVESDSRGGTSQDLTDFFFFFFLVHVFFLFTPIPLFKGEERRNASCGERGGGGGGVNHHALMYMWLLIG